MFRSGGQIAKFAAATALVLATGGGGAQATESRPGVLHLVPPPGEWQALDHCAAYGPDFMSVAGSDACVRIGGRVRVEYGFRRSSSPYDASAPWAASRSATMRSETESAPLGEMLDGVEQGHLHVHSVGVTADPFE